jgi:hypothetical protein
MSSEEGWMIDNSGDYVSPEGKYHGTNKPDGVEFKPFGIVILADAIPGMKAILSVNLLKNEIGIDQAEALVSMLKEHPTLKSICGNRGDETKLDMSGKQMGASGAIMLAAEIVCNGALTTLDISENKLNSGALKAGKRGKLDSDYETDMTGMPTLLLLTFPIITYISAGIIAIAGAIKDMRALTLLILVNNRLCGTWIDAYGELQGTFDSSGMFSAHASFNGD